MRQKVFWAVTALFATGMLFGGIMDIFSQAAVEGLVAAAAVLPFLALLAVSYHLSPRRLCGCACCQGGACKDCHI